jgi:hypothetical protein
MTVSLVMSFFWKLVIEFSLCSRRRLLVILKCVDHRTRTTFALSFLKTMRLTLMAHPPLPLLVP